MTKEEETRKFLCSSSIAGNALLGNQNSGHTPRVRINYFVIAAALSSIVIIFFV